MRGQKNIMLCKKSCLINSLLTNLLSLEFIAAHCKGMLSSLTFVIRVILKIGEYYVSYL